LRQIKWTHPLGQRASLITAPAAIAASSTVTAASAVTARAAAASPIATCARMVARRMANAEPAPKTARRGIVVTATANSADVATNVVASTQSFAR